MNILIDVVLMEFYILFKVLSVFHMSLLYLQNIKDMEQIRVGGGTYIYISLQHFLIADHRLAPLLTFVVPKYVPAGYR